MYKELMKKWSPRSPAGFFIANALINFFILTHIKLQEYSFRFFYICGSDNLFFETIYCENVFIAEIIGICHHVKYILFYDILKFN